MRREDGSDKTAMPVIFEDAQTGEEVFQFDNLQTASGTGSSLYSGTVSLETYLGGSTYYMEDVARRVGTFDNRSATSSPSQQTLDDLPGWQRFSRIDPIVGSC